MEARAIAKYLKISPYKVRPVLDEIKNIPAEQALARLSVSPRKAARFLEKVIQSAIANLKGKGKVADSEIMISRGFVDEGPLVPPFKYRARARGMASRIRNRTCHITIVVTGGEEDNPADTGGDSKKKKEKK